MKKEKSRALHPMVRDIVVEELQAREWGDDTPVVIARLSKVSQANVHRLLMFDHRLTHVECWILERAFGLSDGFIHRLQASCEKQYPDGRY